MSRYYDVQEAIDLNQNWREDLESFDLQDAQKSEVNYNDFIYFENPTRLKAIVSLKIERSLKNLFTQLRAENRKTRRVWIYLHKLFDNSCEMLEIAVRNPTGDHQRFIAGFDTRLDSLDLSNPLTEIEVEVCPWISRRRSHGSNQRS